MVLLHGWCYPMAHLRPLSVKLVGLGFVALSQVPLKPTPDNVPPTGITLFQAALVMVTVGPLAEALPFQAFCATVCPLANWKLSAQVVVGAVPVLVMLMLVPKPLGHWLVTVHAIEHDAAGRSSSSVRKMSEFMSANGISV